MLHVKYEGIVREPDVKWMQGSRSPETSLKLRQLATHIPWEIYNYDETINKLSSVLDQKLPLCSCQKRTI